jgi:hypothetical protein
MHREEEIEARGCILRSTDRMCRGVDVHGMTFDIGGVAGAAVHGTMLHVDEFALVRAPRAWCIHEQPVNQATAI